jgi:5,10-methylene-tetrahydrofolate dehydrogenase/methenyl tetrahydrofolate cyclohydrolase
MDAARDLVAAVTPVPGGVGAVTPYILALHTALAAQRLQNI